MGSDCQVRMHEPSYHRQVSVFTRAHTNMLLSMSQHADYADSATNSVRAKSACSAQTVLVFCLPLLLDQSPQAYQIAQPWSA